MAGGGRRGGACQHSSKVTSPRGERFDNLRRGEMMSRVAYRILGGGGGGC